MYLYVHTCMYTNMHTHILEKRPEKGRYVVEKHPVYSGTQKRPKRDEKRPKCDQNRPKRDEKMDTIR